MSDVEIEEKRNSPRFAWVVEIAGTILSPLEVPEQAPLLLRGVTSDISNGGIGMLSDQLVPSNAVVRCETALPGTPVPIPMLLRVRWFDKVEGERTYKFGLQFLI
jgi:hypothetical protein